MTWAPPIPVSIVGDALDVRYIDLPGLGQDFSIWLAQIEAGGFHFITRDTTEIDFGSGLPVDVTEKYIAGPIPGVVKFDAIESDTANQILLVYEAGDHIWSLVYDFANDLLVQEPTREFRGNHPSLSRVDGLIHITFVRDNALFVRKGLAGDDLQISTQSQTALLDQDTHDSSATPSTVRFTAAKAERAAVSRLMTSEAETTLLIDRSLAVLVPDMSLLQDLLHNHLKYEGIDEYGDAIYGEDIGVSGGNIWPEPAADSHGERAIFADLPVPYRGYRFSEDAVRGNAFYIRCCKHTLPGFSGDGTGVIIGNTAGIGEPPDYYEGGGIGFPDVGEAQWGRFKATGLPSELWDTPTDWFFYFTNQGAEFPTVNANGVNYVMSTEVTGWSEDRYIGRSFTGEIEEIQSHDTIFPSWTELYGEYVGEHDLSPFKFEEFASIFNRFKFVDRTRNTDALVDLSGNLRNMYLEDFGYRARGIENLREHNYWILDLTLPSAFTLEAWVIPGGTQQDAVILRGVDDEFEFGWTVDNLVYFTLKTAVGDGKISFRQTGGRRIDRGQRNHLAYVHTTGLGGNTFMTVNGTPVIGEWAFGDGNEIPSDLSALYTRTEMGPDDQLLTLRLSNVAKTQAQILDYVKGRS